MQGEITASGLIVGGMLGQRGAPGVGIKKIEKTGTSGLIDTYTITYTNGTTFNYEVANGEKGDTGNGITKIEKTGTLGLVDTYTITYDNGTTTTYEVTNGEKGETGATPDFSIGSVTKGDDAEATITGTAEEPILNLVLPAGNGIESIEKTGTAGLVDTYTITFTDETTFTYNVTNGADGNVTDVQVEGTSVVDNGVASITGLATQAELDRYKTIYNVLPKVTGEDETLTLNNTGEATLQLSLKGNTSQTGTPTPSSPIPINVVSGDNEVVVCGKNIWDEQWELGIIRSNNTYDDFGENVWSSNAIRSKNYIPVDNSKTYYCHCGTNGVLFAIAYDENKRAIKVWSGGYGYIQMQNKNRRTLIKNVLLTKISDISQMFYFQFRF